MRRLGRIAAKLVDRLADHARNGNAALAVEVADAISLLARGEQEGGPDVAIFTVVCTLESILRAAEEGVVDPLPSPEVVDENRMLLRILRDELDADEREMVDRLVAARYEGFLRDF